MYVLTNGKEYVMENPYKCGDYRASTSPNHAKHFTFKQGRSLLQNNRKALSTCLIWKKGKRKQKFLIIV